VPTFFVLAAPVGTPATIIARLNAGLRRSLSDAETAAKLATLGLVPTGGSPEESGATIACDITRFGEIAGRVGLTPQ